MACDAEDCDAYPIFGVAPHECYWRKPGGVTANPLGTSTLLPLEHWPDNFLAEINPEIPIVDQLKGLLCGTYYCPQCKGGMKETSTMLGVDTIREIIAKNGELP